METHREFERLASGFLERHPELKYEWREIKDVAGGRTDLIISPGQESEVFASLRDGQIVIGTRTQTRDFETFGRKISQEELAAEALRQMELFVRESETS